MATAARPTRRVVPAIDVRFWIESLSARQRECDLTKQAWDQAVDALDVKDPATFDARVEAVKRAEHEHHMSLVSMNATVEHTLTKMRAAIGDS